MCDLLPEEFIITWVQKKVWKCDVCVVLALSEWQVCVLDFPVCPISRAQKESCLTKNQVGLWSSAPHPSSVHWSVVWVVFTFCLMNWAATFLFWSLKMVNFIIKHIFFQLQKVETGSSELSRTQREVISFRIQSPFSVKVKHKNIFFFKPILLRLTVLLFIVQSPTGCCRCKNSSRRQHFPLFKVVFRSETGRTSC